MKIRAYIIAALLVVNIAASAQQRPQYTQYIFNNYLLNPAISGIENYTDVKVGYRKQWAGIEDAPQTSFITANWKLGGDYVWKNPLSLPEKGEDPMSRNYMQNYTASPSHHGMGVMAVLDEIGPISRLDADVTYAYHLQMARQLNLSVGIAAGLTRIGFDRDALTFDTYPEPAINNTIVSQVKPDLSLGVWLYGARFFAGASVQQVLPQKLRFTNDPGYNLGKEVPHYFITTGYKLFVADDISATPSIMVKKISPTPVSIDANVKMSFKDRFWIGGSYRKNDSFSAMAGINISKLINLTYSYDYITSELNRVTNGSHEIVLGFQLNNVYEVLSTTRMW